MTQCKICNKSFKNLNGLGKHIHNQHPKITREEYYNEYIGTVSPICECGSKKKFRTLGEGYRTFCSHKCYIKYTEPSKPWLGKKQPQEMIDKRRNTIEERYGVNNGFLSKKTQEWYKGFFCHSKNEKVFIDFCEEYGYTLSEPGKIEYEYEGRKRYYYPDFYIEELDCIIEIKSDYTWNLNLDINLAKIEKCLSLNYNIEVIDEEYGLLNKWTELHEHLRTI